MILPHHLPPQILPFSTSCAYYVHYFFSVVSSFWVIHFMRCPHCTSIVILKTVIQFTCDIMTTEKIKIHVWSALLSFPKQDIKSGRSPLIHAVEKSCMVMINFLVEVWLYFCVCFLFYLLCLFSVAFPQQLMTQLLSRPFNSI